MRIADGGGGGDVSSASPQALLKYSTSGMRIDAELEAESVRLGAALIVFEATCKEYSIGVSTVLADELNAFARRTAQDDVWVGKVAAAFAKADGGGLASVLALNPNSVGDWSMLNKLKYALQQALARLPSDVAERLQGMLSPENLAALAVVVGIWGASQFFGVGEVADVVLIGVGLFTIGGDAIKVGEDLGSFAVGIAKADNTGDLDNAGQKLADAISIAGIDGAMALLFHKASKSMPEGSTGVMPELVTPEGIVVNVSSTALESHGVLPITSEPPITPESMISQAIKDGRAAHDGALGDAAAEARATAEEVQAWMDGLPRQNTPTTTPRNQYEITHTGPFNYLVDGGGEKIWADGVRPGDANLLEAKYVDNPARSPYVDGSACPDFVRADARRQVESEFQRYAAVLADPATPVTDLEVIVSDQRAVPYFESLMVKYNIRGQVVVRP